MDVYAVEKAGQMVKWFPPHPFPARMAPEIALNAVQESPATGLVLDPMCGSGTVLRAAALSGRPAVGFDVDPLAVLMSKVWTSNVDTERLPLEARNVVVEASTLADDKLWLQELDGDAETREFVDFWFAAKQRDDLKRLAFVLRQRTGPVADALWLAFSRLIVTKERAASRARDTSHSRPHRVEGDDSFEVMKRFPISVERMAKRLEDPVAGHVTVAHGDARCLAISDQSVSLVVTSPPYLNAIDYLRGHKLSLVWMGYTLGQLRQIRSESIGAERVLRAGQSLLPEGIIDDRDQKDEKTVNRIVSMAERYASDVHAFVGQLRRVLTSGGTAVLVVGNTTVRGVRVSNAELVKQLAQGQGFRVVSSLERRLPANRRYLPPPAEGKEGSMNARVKIETVLRFEKVN